MSTSSSVLGSLAATRLVGWTVNSILYGVLVVQVYLYYIAFPCERTWMKTFAYSLFLVETIQTIMLSYDGIVQIGLAYGDSSQLNSVGISWFSVPLISSIVSTSVQGFFAWRIYVLSESKCLLLFIISLGLIQGGACLAQGILAMKIGEYTLIPEQTIIPMGFWLGGATICDIVIAICMSYYLSRKKTGMRRTDAKLERLVRLSIETGSLTAVVAIVSAITGIGLPQTPYFVAPATVLAKLYTNSFMAILNSRLQIVEGRYEQMEYGGLGRSHIMDVSLPTSTSQTRRLSTMSQRIQIHVTVMESTTETPISVPASTAAAVRARSL